MGEYIDCKYGYIKLGTCEDLYYSRYDDVKSLPEAHAYIGNGFRYRFPFPEEDGTRPGSYEPYNKGYLIGIYPSLAPKLAELIRSDEWDHQEICHSCSYNGAYNVNVFHACPLSRTPPARMSQNGASLAVVLEQQKLIDGELWIVVACPYCGAKVRLEKEYAEEVAACLMNDKQGATYKHKIAERILSGYN